MMDGDHRLTRRAGFVRDVRAAPPGPARELVGAHTRDVMIGLFAHGRGRDRTRRAPADLDVRAPAGEAAAW